MAKATWRLWEPAPAGRVPRPAGRWRDRDGSPLHGVWGTSARDGIEIVVVANHGHLLLGWRVPQVRWRFVSELVRPSNCVLAQVPWVWSDGGRLVATDPPDVAVGLVLAGRKPAALADTDDARLARRWQDAARHAGLHVTKEQAAFDCGPVPTTHWFVHVAVPGPFGDRFDLDALAGDYAACLRGERLADVERAVEELRGLEVADVAADPRLIAPASAGECARTGLTPGYHPATTAGLILHGHRLSWADEEDSALVVGVLAPAAAPAGLPGLPSSLTPQREEVR